MQQQGTRGMRNMHHFYPRGAFYLACMVAGVVLMLLFYFSSGQLWALWVCGLEITSRIVCHEQSLPVPLRRPAVKGNARRSGPLPNALPRKNKRAPSVLSSAALHCTSQRRHQLFPLGNIQVMDCAKSL